jgi:glutathionylspermidine synthase
MPLNRAIEHYHELLTDEVAQDSWEQLEGQLRSRGLFFGDRPLCSVLRPRFFTPEQYRFLRDRCRLLLSAFRSAYERAIADPAFLAQFRLTEWEERLVRHDPGFPEPSPVSRLDAFFVHERGGLKFTEYNAETPAGAAYGDLLAEVFLGLPVMRRFLRRWEVRPLPARHQVMNALLEAWRHWSGGRARPRIAILDWREVPTYSEFLVTVEYLRSQGLECVIADPREVEYAGGRLMADGAPVDLVYKRVLINELVERGGEDHPVVRAVLDGAVCMVNPFRCKILHKKASLAVLSDERNRDLLSREEREAVEAHVPWSRVVEERKTVHRGEEVDLVPFIAENRETLVLKPNDDYGGAGIVLGWEADDARWREALERALAEPCIVQERIEIPSEPYPSLVDGKLHLADRIMDTAPFAFHGEYVDGCLTRLSTESLVNVTAGGGSSLANFIIGER